jgi:hypothetical protein
MAWEYPGVIKIGRLGYWSLGIMEVLCSIDGADGNNYHLFLKF